MGCLSDFTLDWGTGVGLGVDVIFGTKGTVVLFSVGRLFLLLFTVFQSGYIDLPVFAGVRN